MTLNAVYQLPFGKHGPLSPVVGGWEVTGIVGARTGLPVNIGVSRSASALPDGYTSGQRIKPLDQALGHLRQDHRCPEYGRDRHRCSPPHRVPIPG